MAGLFRPALYLPRNGEREERQDWMLRHEAAHLRRGHLRLKALGGAVGILYWFDPLVPALRRRLEEACELESDRAVCGEMGPEERREYAGLLLAFAEKAPGPGGSGFSRRGRQLETRILALRRGGAAFGRRGLSVLALALVLACLPVQAFCRQELGGLEEGSRLLQGALHSKSVDYRYHGSDLSYLEAVLARGDRRLGDVLAYAVRHGARLDGWDEYFDNDIWMEAFAACGVDPAFYAQRTYQKDEVLPWQTIDVGVRPSFLWRERELAYASQTTPDCRTHCSGCGANQLEGGVICDA